MVARKQKDRRLTLIILTIVLGGVILANMGRQ